MKTLSGIIMVILLLLTISETLNAQQSTFAKVFYDNYGGAQAYSIIRSSDNNYMIAGEKDNGGLLIKMDPDGNILWNKRYGSNGYERFNVIVETDDSCFVMAGYHQTFAGIQNVLCVKVNSQGDTIWSRTIDNGFYGTALSISKTYDNGYILTGFTYQTTGPSTIMIVDKLDADGNLSWSRTLVCGTHHNEAYSVKQTPDSGYIVTGCFENYTPVEYPAVMIKLTPAGDVSWAYKYAGNSYSCINDISVTWNGLLFSATKDYDVELVKTDFSGNVLWSKAGFGGLYGGDDPMPKLHRTSDGGYAWVNSYELVKADSAGNFLWSQELLFYPSDVIESVDKGFLALGNGPMMGVEFTETFNPQIGIIKTDSLGNSSACVTQQNVWTDTITSVLVPVSVTTTTAGTQADLPLIISNAGLSADSGCVAATGGVRETIHEKNSLLVYPDPSNGMIQVKTDQKSEDEIKFIRIYNGTGKCIYQSADPSSIYSQIDLNTAADGIYYIQAVFEGVVRTQLFTIIH